MMRALLPRTLLGRTILVLILTVALTQIATQLVFQSFVTAMYGRQLVRVGANNLIAIGLALRAIEPARRAEYAAQTRQSEGLMVLPVAQQPGPPAEVLAPLPDRLQRLEERLRERLGAGAQVLLDASSTPPRVWARLPMPDGDWWVEFERAQFDRAFPLSAALLLGCSLAIAVAVAWFTVRRINEPLRLVQQNILALSLGSRQPRPINAVGPAEIVDLALAVERTASALRQSDQERALLLAGVSHDLRTPLSRLRLAVELLQPERGEEQDALVADIEEIDRIIDQFLDFARNPELVEGETGSLSDVARECGARAALRIPALELDLAEGLDMRMRRPALDRLINNLLENARRYAAAPITLRACRSGTQLELSVLDRGPGIPPDQVERLLQPFTRLDASRTGPGGAGLGLAIVDRIARAHGGRLELLPREGGGLHARVLFPAGTQAG